MGVEREMWVHWDGRRKERERTREVHAKIEKRESVEGVREREKEKEREKERE